MAKINTTVLPTATQEYEALQFDTLIRILEQITQQLNFGFQQDLKDDSTSKEFFPWLIILKEQVQLAQDLNSGIATVAIIKFKHNTTNRTCYIYIKKHNSF